MPVRRTFFPAFPAVALAAALSTTAAPAATFGSRLPDGVYRCEAYMLGMFLTLGEITIRGNVYSGPNLSGEAPQGYHYQLSPDGDIAWLGPLGGYTSGGNSISLTQVTSDGDEDASFDIIMRQPDGAFSASTCTLARP